MQPNRVSPVLATRTFELEDAGVVHPVTVLIGTPRRIPGGADFYCPYQVIGLGDETIRRVEGVDEAQAIYIAMEAVGTRLAMTEEARAGRLTWYGQTSLGFPVREERQPLRLVACS